MGRTRSRDLPGIETRVSAEASQRDQKSSGRTHLPDKVVRSLRLFERSCFHDGGSPGPLNFDAESSKNLRHRLHIVKIRSVPDRASLRRQKRHGHERKGRVLGPASESPRGAFVLPQFASVPMAYLSPTSRRSPSEFLGSRSISIQPLTGRLQQVFELRLPARFRFSRKSHPTSQEPRI